MRGPIRPTRAQREMMASIHSVGTKHMTLKERKDMATSATDTTKANHAKQVKARADNPTSWIAVDVGDVIKGDLVEIVAAWSDNRNNGAGGFYPMLKLANVAATGYEPVEGRDMNVHCYGAVLSNEVQRQRPMPGETVTITYKGTSDREPRPGQNRAELYGFVTEGLNRGDAAERAYAELFGTGTSPEGSGN